MARSKIQPGSHGEITGDSDHAGAVPVAHRCSWPRWVSCASDGIPVCEGLARTRCAPRRLIRLVRSERVLL